MHAHRHAHIHAELFLQVNESLFKKKMRKDLKNAPLNKSFIKLYFIQALNVEKLTQQMLHKILVQRTLNREFK